jgi:hypothetical protein
MVPYPKKVGPMKPLQGIHPGWVGHREVGKDKGSISKSVKFIEEDRPDFESFRNAVNSYLRGTIH